jgi:hypothetical protein
VIPTTELTRSFDGLDIVRLFHNTDNGLVTLRVSAELARFYIGDGVADRTMKELVLDLEHRRSQGAGVGSGDLQQMMSQPSCGLGADARQAAELSDETRKRVTHDVDGAWI